MVSDLKIFVLKWSKIVAQKKQVVRAQRGNSFHSKTRQGGRSLFDGRPLGNFTASLNLEQGLFEGAPHKWSTE